MSGDLAGVIVGSSIGVALSPLIGWGVGTFLGRWLYNSADWTSSRVKGRRRRSRSDAKRP